MKMLILPLALVGERKQLEEKKVPKLLVLGRPPEPLLTSTTGHSFSSNHRAAGSPRIASKTRRNCGGAASTVKGEERAREGNRAKGVPGTKMKEENN